MNNNSNSPVTRKSLIRIEEATFDSSPKVIETVERSSLIKSNFHKF
jgi:hypothetical protein